MAALGWLLNLDFAAGEVAAPVDVIARSRMLHFSHHSLFLGLIGGLAALWA